MRDLITMLDDLKQRGVKFRSLTEAIDTDTPTGRGMWQLISPDLYTGTGNFTVPIALLPGRNGFKPQLNLTYSTGNGNGPFGLGGSRTSEVDGPEPGVGVTIDRLVPARDIACGTVNAPS